MNEQISALFRDVLQESDGNSSLVSNQFVLTSDYLPEKFSHRAKQLKELIRYFHSFFQLLDAHKSPQFRQIVLILGNVGTGKTSIVKRFGIEFETFAGEKYPFLAVKYRHINCRKNRTVYSVLVHLLQSLIPYFPNRGFSPADLLRILQTHLRDTNTYLLLTLDEIDVLALQDPEFYSFMYSLTRLNDELLLPSEPPSQHISLILISRDSHTLELCDTATRSSLPKNVVFFPKYTSDQLVDILQERCYESESKGITPSTLQKIAEFTSSTGDARYAIDLLWQAIHLADTQKASTLLLKHIEAAHTNVFSVSKDRINDLELAHKLFLLTVAKWMLDNPSQEYMTMDKVKKYLPVYAERLKVKVGRGNTSLWLYMKALSSLGLINTHVESSGRLGRTTMISLDLSPKLLVKELEKAIKKSTPKKKTKRTQILK